MKKHYFNIIAIVLTTVCIILAIVLMFKKLHSTNKTSSNTNINSKIMSEISYVDTEIIDAMNKLNNITCARYKTYTKAINKNENKEEDEEKQKTKNKTENKNENNDSISQSIATNPLTQTNNNDVNWNEVTNLYENVYSAWPTINIDLKKIGIGDENLSKFNLDLNGLAQSINSKDKKSALINLYNLYEQLPTFAKAVSEDPYTIINYNTKSAILNAYTLASEEDKWQEMSSSISKAKNNFGSLVQSDQLDENKKIELEKTYAIISDLENSLVLNDKNIFFMNYKNTIQSLEAL